MKPFLTAVLIAAMLAGPAWADDPEMEEGTSLIEEGAKLFFRGLMQEMEPAIEDLQDLSQELEPALREFVQEMQPALRELMDKVDDITLYHAPEVLPNGDILLRRKQPEEIPPELQDGGEPGIEL